MITGKIKVDGVSLFIIPSGFVFVRQTCVKFYGMRLSKEQLIKCCKYFINELKVYCSPGCLKIGFNLKCFAYYELSVYLHGLISLYCSKAECSCPMYFGLFRYSRLPHNVIKSDDRPFDNEALSLKKEDFEIPVVVMQDLDGKNLYVCALRGSVECSYTFDGIKERFRSLNSWLFDNYNVIFVLSDGTK